MIARELDEEPQHGTEHQIQSDDLAGSVLPSESPVEESEHQGFRPGLIELRGMQRDLQRDSREHVRRGIVEFYCPRNLGLDSPAASGGEAADLANRVTQRQSRSEGVRGAEQREALLAHIEDCGHQRENQPALENTRGLERGQRKDRAGIRHVAIPIEHDHQDLGAQHPGQSHVDREVRDQLGVQAAAAGQFHRNREPGQKGQGNHTP